MGNDSTNDGIVLSPCRTCDASVRVPWFSLLRIGRKSQHAPSVLRISGVASGQRGLLLPKGSFRLTQASSDLRPGTRPSHQKFDSASIFLSPKRRRTVLCCLRAHTTARLQLQVVPTSTISRSTPRRAPLVVSPDLQDILRNVMSKVFSSRVGGKKLSNALSSCAS